MDSSTFVVCTVLNNRGVDEFTKEQNLEEACKFFCAALRCLSKHANQLASSRKMNKQARHKLTAITSTKQDVVTTQQRNAWTAGTTSGGYPKKRNGVTDDEAEQQKAIIVIQRAAFLGESNLGEKLDWRDNAHHACLGLQLQNCTIPSFRKQGLQRRRTKNDVGGPKHSKSGVSNIASSTTSSSPIRLSRTANASTDTVDDSLRQVSLSTAVVCFNLALTHARMGFLVTAVSGDDEDEKGKHHWESAFALYELACSMRLSIQKRRNSRGADSLALLDRILLQNTKELHAQLNVDPSPTGGFLRLAELQTDQLKKLYQRRGCSWRPITSKVKSSISVLVRKRSGS